MRLYVEPIVFFLAFDKNKLSMKIFEKARNGKLELVTSVWSVSQYIGAVNELYVKGELSQQSRNDYLFEFSRLENDLKDSLVKVYPTKEIQDVCISFILDRSVDYERAWHLATARLSRCTDYAMVDRYQDLDRRQWTKDFEVFNILDEYDAKQLSERIDSL
ncbi:MAG: hypothetical protein WCC52_03485 [Nitrosotalea sp.]